MNTWLRAVALSVLLTAMLAGTAVAQAQEVPEGWKSMAPAGLAAEFSKLSSQGQQEDCRRLADYAAQRYQAASADGTLKIGDWLPVAMAMGGRLPGGTQASIVRRIQDDLVPNEQTVIKLSADRLLEIARALRELGCPGTTIGSMASIWVRGSEKYKSLDPAALSHVTYFLGLVGRPGEAARDRIAAHVEASYLKDAGAIRSVTPSQWQRLISSLRPSLSSEARKNWSGKLFAAYVKEADVIGKLTLDDCRSLRATLSQLGFGGFLAVVPKWVTSTNAWQSFTPDQLAELAGEISGLRQMGKKACEAFIGHIETTYMADASKIRSFPARAWRGLARSIRVDLSEEKRAAWAEKLDSAFGDVKALAALSYEDCRLIREALRQLFSKQADTLLARWAISNDSWRSWEAVRLAELAGGIPRFTDVGKQARAALVKHIETKFLADSASMRLVPVPAWLKLVGRLRVDLSEQAKAAWAGKLHSVYAGSGEALANLSYEACGPLEKTLRQLDSKDTDTLFARWTIANSAWQSWKADELVGLCKRIMRLSENDKAARAAIIQHVRTKMLADAETVKKTDLRGCAKLLGCLLKDISHEDRAAWAESLYSAYKDKAQALETLTHNDCLLLSAILRQLGSKRAQELLPIWVEVGKAWQKLELKSLMRLAGDLAKLKEAGRSSHSALASYIEGKYLKDTQTIRATPLATSRHVIEAFVGVLSPEAKARWAGKFYAAYVTDSGVLASQGLTDCDVLVRLLRRLDSEQAGTVLPKWMEASKSWRSWPSEKLADLYKKLRNLGKQGEASREKLVEHVRSGVLADAASIKAAGLRDTCDLLLGISQDVSDETCTALAGKLYSVYDGKASALQTLRHHDCGRLRDTLDRLGRTDADRILPMWVEHTQLWHTEKMGHLIGLAGQLSRLKDTAQGARRVLADYAQKNFLTDEVTIRAVPLQRWARLVGCLAGDLTGEAKATWASKLRSAHAPNDDVIATLDFAQCRALWRILAHLGAKDSATMPLTWMRLNDSWQDWKLLQLKSLDSSLRQLGDAGKDAREKLLKHIEEKFLATDKAVRSVSPRQWWDTAGYYGKNLPAASLKTWVAALRRAYVDDANVFKKLKSTEVIALSRALKLLGDEKSKELFDKWLATTS